MPDTCYFCGHTENEHLGKEYDCERDGCSCVEFTPPPDPRFRFRWSVGEEREEE